MTRRRKPPKPKNRNTPESEAKRKSSAPKTPEEQVQTIADDIKSEVISYLYRYTLEQELVKETVERALGRGGGKLEEFINELESGYSQTVPQNDTAQSITNDKDNRPVLKEVSKRQKTEIILPKDKKGNMSKSSKRRKK